MAVPIKTSFGEFMAVRSCVMINQYLLGYGSDVAADSKGMECREIYGTLF